ncbi:MAG TPA: alpha/beta fold hydrolase [Egicoccus sp.]|nr:alpha/beta fold hydrolase [Egicoccus sp.]HSK22562.1 alpha/beta fold hydrolase [Egicoccus sp.]
MTATDRPRLVLVHGATSGPWVFDAWLPHLAAFDVRVPDLQVGLEVASATMSDYADRVMAAAGGGGAVLCGWSMGGLVAMLAALRQPVAALVLVEPSQPRQLGRADPSVTPVAGTYDAESMYGPLPADTRHRPESRFALGERRRGVDIPLVESPLLVVAGSSHPVDRGRDVVDHYGGELLEFPDLDHTGLVRDPGVAVAIADWLTTTTRGRSRAWR